MAAKGTVTVKILGDARGFGGALREAEGRVNRFGGHMRSSFTRLAGIGAGLIATVGITNFLRSSIEEAREAAEVARQTEAVIRSTGGAANVTAGDIDRLATSLSNKTAIDDETIASGENLLLTFTKVRNEAGEGNDIFNQATATALDMSVAMGTDLNGAVMQVGKALNDPIKGVTALGRAGVQFTKDQKEQIKVLVESGDVLGAQKIILAELETQFGGSAAAASDPMQRLGVVIGNLKEQLGAALLPVIETVASWLGERLPGALDAVGRAFGQVRDAVMPFFNTLRTGFTEDEGTKLENFALKVRELALWISGTLWPAIQRVVEAVGGWQNVLIAAGVVIAAVVSPIGVLVAALVYAYTEFEGFRNVVDSVVAWLTGTAWPAIQQFATLLQEKWTELAGWTREHWAAIREAVGHVVVAIQFVIDTFVSYITVLWRQWGDEIKNIAQAAWDQVRLLVETAINLVRGVIETVTALINGDWGEAWEAFKGILSTAWDFIVDYVGNALQIVGQLVEGALSALRTIWDIAWGAIGSALAAAWDAMKQQVSSSVGAVVDFFAGLPGRALGALGDFAGALRNKAFEILAGFLSGLTEKVGEVMSFFSELPGRIVGQIPNALGLLYDIGADIIRGLINGIRDMVGQLLSVARGIANQIRDTIGGALDSILPGKSVPGFGKSAFDKGAPLGAFAGSPSRSALVPLTINVGPITVNGDLDREAANLLGVQVAALVRAGHG